MTVQELFQEGRLQEALAALNRDALNAPGNMDAQLFLCELLLFAGDLDGVRKRLDNISQDLPSMREYVEDYLQLLSAESKRQRLLIDVDPGLLLEPPEHFALRLEAVQLLRQGRFDQAVHTLDEADAHAPWVAGHIDGREFDGARDCDDLLAPFLEVLVDDQYVWFPMEQIGRLRLAKPASIRDRLFIPAQLSSKSGQTWNVYLPALYAGSHLHADNDIRLGRTTDWNAEPGGPIQGIGLRTLTLGEEELALLDFTQWEC